MVDQQNPDEDRASMYAVGERLERTVPLLEQVTKHMRDTNVQLLSISTDMVGLHQELRRAVQRQSILVVLLCAVCLGGGLLLWHLIRGADSIDYVASEAREARSFFEVSGERLKELEKMQGQLAEQQKLLEALRSELPRVVVDSKARVHLEVAASEAAARAVARRQGATAPVTTSGRVQIELP